jgi:uncharacterized protein (DUF2141 family)
MTQRLLTSLVLAIVGNLIISTRVGAVLMTNLTVTISGLKTQQGQICLSLFSNGQGFPGQGDRAIQARCVRATEAPLTISFENLAAGSYAIAVFHDVNDDGVLNRNLLGIPTEGFGFSRNPRILAGAPRFGDSAVLVAGAETNIQIQLLYF